MQAKPYQTEAVEQLLTRGHNLLRKTGNKDMVFKAPTGSGKTVMMAEFLMQLVSDKTRCPRRPLAFIWIAPRQLHAQSSDKLEQYYEDSMALECVNFNGLSDRQIGENQVLFLNWESIRQQNKNTIVRENEEDFYLGKVVENTKNERDIVLIIDESHHHAKSEASRKLIADIAPKLTIEVSATPKTIKSPDDAYTVHLEQVKEAGMIKKSVIINEDFDNLWGGDAHPTLTERGDMIVLARALAKREEIARAYGDARIGVNPLLCIQLPDQQQGREDNLKDDLLRELKDKHGVTAENGKLAIYLSGEQKNMGNIFLNDNGAEVLIFKQAIALGWDCPRAQILVLFRHWQSFTFSVQTLGRIMRMPEPETGYYNDDILNHAYVYTNLSDMSINEDVAGGYVSVYTNQRIDDYKPIELSSVHSLRQRERTRLSPRFNALFLQAASDYGLAEKLNTSAPKVQTSFITDYKADNIDALVGEEIEGGVQLDVNNEADLQKLFDYFARDNLSPYYPESRSVARVRAAIYAFYDAQMGMHYGDCFGKIMDITLSEGNRPHFERVLSDAKDLYKKETASRKEPLQKTHPWELPETSRYGDNYASRKAAKSAMHPFYAAKNEPQTEKAFIKYLDNSNEVEWWYKNGESESAYFAVPYTEDGEEKPFYADFIVQFKDGTVGIYDTKSGMTLDAAAGKSDGLLKYIRDENRRQKGKLKGGIVTHPKNDLTKWKVYGGKGADIGKLDSPDWKWLDF